MNPIQKGSSHLADRTQLDRVKTDTSTTIAQPNLPAIVQVNNVDYSSQVTSSTIATLPLINSTILQDQILQPIAPIPLISKTLTMNRPAVFSAFFEQLDKEGCRGCEERVLQKIFNIYYDYFLCTTGQVNKEMKTERDRQMRFARQASFGETWRDFNSLFLQEGLKAKAAQLIHSIALVARQYVSFEAKQTTISVRSASRAFVEQAKAISKVKQNYDDAFGVYKTYLENRRNFSQASEEEKAEGIEKLEQFIKTAKRKSANCTIFNRSTERPLHLDFINAVMRYFRINHSITSGEIYSLLQEFYPNTKSALTTQAKQQLLVHLTVASHENTQRKRKIPSERKNTDGSSAAKSEKVNLEEGDELLEQDLLEAMQKVSAEGTAKSMEYNDPRIQQGIHQLLFDYKPEASLSAAQLAAQPILDYADSRTQALIQGLISDASACAPAANLRFSAPPMRFSEAGAGSAINFSSPPPTLLNDLDDVLGIITRSLK